MAITVHSFWLSCRIVQISQVPRIRRKPDCQAIHPAVAALRIHLELAQQTHLQLVQQIHQQSTAAQRQRHSATMPDPHFQNKSRAEQGLHGSLLIVLPYATTSPSTTGTVTEKVKS